MVKTSFSLISLRICQVKYISCSPQSCLALSFYTSFLSPADGILLKELNRLLRYNGYFVYSAPPAYRRDKDFPMIWDKLVNLTSAMCWKLIARKVQTAIWIKQENLSCLLQNAEQNLFDVCDREYDSGTAWNKPLRNCMILDTSKPDFQKLPPRPERLSVYSLRLEALGMYSFLKFRGVNFLFMFPFVMLNLFWL